MKEELVENFVNLFIASEVEKACLPTVVSKDLPPEDYKDETSPVGYEAVMSNQDHEVKKKVEEYIKQNKVVRAYPAMWFCSDVWFLDGLFYCKIMQFRNHKETIKRETLEEIMEYACETYGYA